jgi:hypothetical protein
MADPMDQCILAPALALAVSFRFSGCFISFRTTSADCIRNLRAFRRESGGKGAVATIPLSLDATSGPDVKGEEFSIAPAAISGAVSKPTGFETALLVQDYLSFSMR